MCRYVHLCELTVHDTYVYRIIISYYYFGRTEPARRAAGVCARNKHRQVV